MRLAPVVLILVVIAAAVAAEARPGVFFKIAMDETTYSSLIIDNTTTDHTSTVHQLAMRLNEPDFDLDLIEKNFYHVNIRRGLRFLEHPVVEYELSPVLTDRFRHVVWVDMHTNHILRREVYDLTGKLVYAYGYIDEVPDDRVSPRPPKTFKTSDAGQWRGFTETVRRTSNTGAVHRLFSDGLNRVSVFIAQAGDEHPHVEKKRIMYGNYVLRTVVDGRLYTVVGTIPFDSMKTFIGSLEDSKEDTTNEDTHADDAPGRTVPSDARSAGGADAADDHGDAGPGGGAGHVR